MAKKVRYLSPLMLDEDSVRYEAIKNNRNSWGIGFSVEVFSKSDDYWYPGCIINVSSNIVLEKKTVEVIYNGKTKRLPLLSGDIRTLKYDPTKKSRLNFEEVLCKVNKMLEQHKPEQKATELDVFISYSQVDAKDAAALLNLLLQRHNVNAWLDMQQTDISVSGMSSGIAISRFFLIFLTKSYFNRVFTMFELETALALNKKIIVVWEGEMDRGGLSDFKMYIDACPDKYKAALFQNEALKFERRRQLQESQIRVIAERIQDPYPDAHKSSCCNQCDIL